MQFSPCHCRLYRRCRICLKYLERYAKRYPMHLFLWVVAAILISFAFCIYFGRDDEVVYTAFGSVFTALAFAGVIVTVLLQRAELQEQRKELRAQRIELEGQKRELEIQNRTAQLQRFENGFFHLLASFKNTLEVLREQLMDDRFKKILQMEKNNVARYVLRFIIT